MIGSNKFSNILQANQAANNLTEVAFLIKLNALNALLLATRAGQSMKGFIVVSEELIVYSQQILDYSKKIQSLIYEQVLDLSKQLKNECFNRLFLRVQMYSDLEYDQKIGDILDKNSQFNYDFHESIQRINVELHRILLSGGQFSSRGEFLAIHARIESAQSNENSEIFFHVAEDLHKYVQIIKKTIVQIKTLLKKSSLENSAIKGLGAEVA
jgi:hypothetical protein